MFDRWLSRRRERDIGRIYDALLGRRHDLTSYALSRITGISHARVSVLLVSMEADEMVTSRWDNDRAPYPRRRVYRVAHSYHWPCGCLVNTAGAHRVGCLDFPEGRKGTDD